MEKLDLSVRILEILSENQVLTNHLTEKYDDFVEILRKIKDSENEQEFKEAIQKLLRLVSTDGKLEENLTKIKKRKYRGFDMDEIEKYMKLSKFLANVTLKNVRSSLVEEHPDYD